MRTTTSYLGRALALAAAGAALIPAPALAQQQPIYGCRQSINCRPSPVGNSALLDPGVSGLFVGISIKWGPGFHMGLVTPTLNVPLVSQEPTYDVKEFHLRNASLLSIPEPTPAADIVPAPTTPAPK